MIKSFTHKGLKRLFIDNDRRLLNAKDLPKINRILDLLDSVMLAEDINLPGYGLHKPTGDRKGIWSVKVSGNWRITFRFENGHAYEVNLEDYH